MKIRNIAELYAHLPEDELIMVDILRQIISDNIPSYCQEKISFNVPFFIGNRGLCIVWPATIPRGGIKSGVLLGFWQGRHLTDAEEYLTRGTNKKVYYRIFYSPEEIKVEPITQLLKEAVLFDLTYNNRK